MTDAFQQIIRMGGWGIVSLLLVLAHKKNIQRKHDKRRPRTFGRQLLKIIATICSVIIGGAIILFTIITALSLMLSYRF